MSQWKESPPKGQNHDKTQPTLSTGKAQHRAESKSHKILEGPQVPSKYENATRLLQENTEKQKSKVQGLHIFKKKFSKLQFDIQLILHSTNLSFQLEQRYFLLT